MKKISIVTSCWNEAGNIETFYTEVLSVLKKFPQYDYEFIVADNLSTDGTREILRKIAAEDKKFKVIFNSNNFGHIRSPYNAFLNASGDAVVMLCSDLQEPPKIIAEFIRKWEEGFQVVAGVRAGIQKGFIMEFLRSIYYLMLDRIAPDQKLIRKFTGFGLYDRVAVEAIQKFHMPYPYFRGIVSEIGFRRTEVAYIQEERRSGHTKNNLFTLYDIAVTGVVNHTKLPLRLAVFFGFLLAFTSFGISMAYLAMKLIYWDTFSFGQAPMMIGIFFFASIQLIFIGILGEYIGAIWTQVRNRPLVIEEERINF